MCSFEKEQQCKLQSRIRAFDDRVEDISNKMISVCNQTILERTQIRHIFLEHLGVDWFGVSGFGVVCAAIPRLLVAHAPALL